MDNIETSAGTTADSWMKHTNAANMRTRKPCKTPKAVTNQNIDINPEHQTSQESHTQTQQLMTSLIQQSMTPIVLVAV